MESIYDLREIDVYLPYLTILRQASYPLYPIQDIKHMKLSQVICQNYRLCLRQFQVKCTPCLRRLPGVLELAYTLTKMSLKNAFRLEHDRKVTKKSNDHKVQMGMRIKI